MDYKNERIGSRPDFSMRALNTRLGTDCAITNVVKTHDRPHRFFKTNEKVKVYIMPSLEPLNAFRVFRVRV